MEKGPREIIMALLFREPDAARDLGPPLWAALREVEAFFVTDGRERAVFRRAFLAPKVPAEYREEKGWLDFRQQAIEAEVGDESKWAAVREEYGRTYDQGRMAVWARRLTGSPTNGQHLLLVTDVELTPPEGWRYVIWWETPGAPVKDYVISAAPVDPVYWRTQDPRRTATIKHRVRTACLSSVAAALGIDECRNPACFRCKPVESVLDLDRMRYLGEEHGEPGLARRGFEPYPVDPPPPDDGGVAGGGRRPPKEPFDALWLWLGKGQRPPRPRAGRKSADRPRDPAEVQPVVLFPQNPGGVAR